MRSFGHLERDVMRVVWRATEPVTGHDIARQLPAGREIAYTTLITVVDRLRDEGVLTRFRDGRSFRYRATVTEEQYAADLMAEALHASDDRSKPLFHFEYQADDCAAMQHGLRTVAGALLTMCTAGPGRAPTGASWTGGRPSTRIRRFLTARSARPRIVPSGALAGAALLLPVTPSIAAIAPAIAVANTEVALVSHHKDVGSSVDFGHHP